MGVQAEVSGRQERRAAPTQDETLSAKRFKPSPTHGPLTVQGDETSLKIRFSRYNAPPGSQQTKMPGSSSPVREDEEMELTSSPTKPAGRVTRASAATAEQHSTSEDKIESGLANVKLCEVRVSPLKGDVKDDFEDDEVKPHPFPLLDVQMTGQEVVTECERVGPPPHPQNISTSVLEEGVPTPMPKLRSQLPKLTEDQLLPPTPSVHVKTSQDAYSPQLLDWCLQRPITVIRGLTQACNIDLGLYTVKTLVQTNPHHPVEVRTQLEQHSDENWAPSLEEQVWYCTSSRSHTTIQKYAEYYATSFKEAKEKLRDEFSVNPKLETKTNPETGLPDRKTIKFGTNCDLSDEKKWKPQIQELMKLPSWLRIVSAGNMLSHVGHQILGMNTLQLYMKVPCSRTPGHQENNNFAAVNINIGPGDSEWFGVPDSYWGPLQELCEKNNVDYLHGSWWPKMEDLKEAGIPCYRFMQRPGELVWVNTGCVHWVQASGWCNNVAWNTGPLTHRQYKTAIERYEWNKVQRYQSIVAMVYLTWNMAQNIQVSDPGLYKAMKTTLMRSLRQSVLMKLFAVENNIPVRFHGHGPNEPVNYCMVCEEEVFNILYVREHEKKHVVHCLKCAQKLAKDWEGWTCLEEYDIEHLMSIFDNFTLGDSTVTMVNNNNNNKEESQIR